jgi:hypothetical protein
MSVFCSCNSSLFSRELVVNILSEIGDFLLYFIFNFTFKLVLECFQFVVELLLELSYILTDASKPFSVF